MIGLSCAQIPECKMELVQTQQLLCKAFIVYIASMKSVYIPLNPKANIRKAKKTGYEIVETSWRKIESTALGLALLIGNGSFPTELVPFCAVPGIIEYINERELIDEFKRVQNDS